MKLAMHEKKPKNKNELKIVIKYVSSWKYKSSVKLKMIRKWISRPN